MLKQEDRTMRLDDERESENFEVQRGGGGGFGGGGGMLGFLLPLVASRFGCGGVVVLLIGFAIFGGLGNLGSIIGGGGVSPLPQSATAPKETSQLTPVQHWSLKVLASTEDTWGQLFAKQGQRYEPTTLVFYHSSGQSGCGAAQAAMGPFYCPADHRVYLDTDFFDELKSRFGAQGDFAQAYVIAHEVGHHVQTLSGISDKVRQIQQNSGEAAGNAAQVKMELQADCYAGVWATNTHRLEPGDVEEGLTAAQAIGDDTLQRSAGQVPVPDSFTHGTSEQRMKWLKRGLDTGDPAQCDTFGTGTI
jgi:predicted metalloprotease